MTEKDYVTNKELFDAIKTVWNKCDELSTKNPESYSKDFFFGVKYALHHLQSELGYLPQLRIKDRDY